MTKADYLRIMLSQPKESHHNHPHHRNWHYHSQHRAVSLTCRTDDDTGEISPIWCERNKCCTANLPAPPSK